MLIYGHSAAFYVKTSLYCVNNSSNISSKSSSNFTRYSRRCNLAAAAAAVIISAAGAPAAAAAEELVPQDSETLSNIPQTLSGDCPSTKDCKKPRIQRPKSRKAELCTTKCLTACIRGGEGSPGEGPFSIIRPLVVFKEGYRSRKYCLVECSDICNLIGDWNNTDKNQGGEEENQTLNEMRKEFTAKDTQFNPPKIPRSVQNAVASG